MPRDKAKNRRARKVRITEEQKLTIIEIQRRYQDRPTIDHIKNYSKVFKKALRHSNIDESKHQEILLWEQGVADSNPAPQMKVRMPLL